MEPSPDQIVCALFEEHGVSLYRFAFRLTRSAETADDLVQEAFLALYTEFRRGRELENPRAWMLGLISNQAARSHREARRWVGSPELLDTIPGRSGNGRSGWDVAEDELLPLLDLLSAREAEVILLRLQSLKYREIADALGISHKSVATLLARAVQKMQQGAEERGYGQALMDWSCDDASLHR